MLQRVTGISGVRPETEKADGRCVPISLQGVERCVSISLQSEPLPTETPAVRERP